jgi:hypothetical protein
MSVFGSEGGGQSAKRTRGHRRPARAHRDHHATRFDVKELGEIEMFMPHLADAICGLLG